MYHHFHPDLSCPYIPKLESYGLPPLAQDYHTLLIAGMQRLDAFDLSQAALLNIVDQFRHYGVAGELDLPQLVVCGDQSSGKSSVLEAISGVQFPTNDILCTRFALEFVIRRADSQTLSATIRPGPERTVEDQAKLRAFTVFKNETDSTNASDLFATIVENAANIIFDHDGRRGFSEDVLRIELTGPDLPLLSLVDLPGLFHGSGPGQTEEDAKFVKKLVLKYMSHSRTIILAIVSADRELANQVVTKLAKRSDSLNRRTLGIITKPDTLEDSPNRAEAYFKVAQNEEMPYKLGWHVLKNRGHKNRDLPQSLRDSSESDFLSRGIWARLPDKHKGIGSLISRLGSVLQAQIIKTLPGLIEDFQLTLASEQGEMELLRESVTAIDREELFEISTEFTSLLSNALEGHYNLPFFRSPKNEQNNCRELRTVVENLIDQFDRDLRRHGHSVELLQAPADKSDTSRPRQLCYDDYVRQVEGKIRTAGGVPGQFNHRLTSELFYDQSKAWPNLVDQLIVDILDAVEKCLTSILQATAAPRVCQSVTDLVLTPALLDLESSLRSYAKERMSNHESASPITFSKTITDHIPLAREREIRRVSSELLSALLGNQRIVSGSSSRARLTGPVDIDSLTDDFVKELNIYRFTSVEAITCMQAHYKVPRTLWTPLPSRR
jgi:GTPase SAR1 family protein